MTKNEEPKYCSCCGKTKKNVMKQIMKQEPNEKGIRIWEGHKKYPKTDYFYENNELEYCEYCGELLSDEDINEINESRGEFDGAPRYERVITGYTCHNCGKEMKM